MKRAYSYIRFSTPEQSKGDSQRRQLTLAREYCERNHLKLDESLTVRDLGVSAFKGKNIEQGALGRFLEAVKTGTVESGAVLLVEHLDRISRDKILSAQKVFLGILEAGVEVVTLIDGKRYTEDSVNANPTDLIFSIVHLMTAHDESKKKSERIGAAWEAKRASVEKRPLTAKCPTWMELNPKTQEFDLIPEREKTMKRIVNMGLDGLGSYKIAATLNQEGVPCWGRTVFHGTKKIARWDFGTVQYLLRSPALIGTYQPKKNVGHRHIPQGDPVKGYYPRIVSDADYYKLQAVLDGRKTNNRGRTGREVTNLFGRLLVSGFDGGRMLLRKSHSDRKATMISMNYLQGVSKETQSFPYDDFERYFLTWICEIELSDENRPSSGVDEFEGKLAETRKNIEKLEAEMESGGSFERGVALLRKLETKETELKSALEAERNKVHSPVAIDTLRDIEKLSESLQGAPVEARSLYRSRLRTRIQGIVKQVTIWAGGRKLVRAALVEVELQSGGCYWFAIRKERKHLAASVGTLQPVGKCDFDKQYVLDSLIDPRGWLKARTPDKADPRTHIISGDGGEVVTLDDGTHKFLKNPKPIMTSAEWIEGRKKVHPDSVHSSILALALDAAVGKAVHPRRKFTDVISEPPYGTAHANDDAPDPFAVTIDHKELVRRLIEN